MYEKRISTTGHFQVGGTENWVPGPPHKHHPTIAVALMAPGERRRTEGDQVPRRGAAAGYSIARSTSGRLL